MASRVQHLSLLAKFSVLSLVCVAGLGVALAAALHDQLHDRAAADARQLAERVAAEIAHDHVTARELAGRIPPRKLARLDASIEKLQLQGTIENAKLFDSSGALKYSLERGEIGELHDDAGVRSAIAGRTVADFHEEGGETTEYEVYVPLRLAETGPPAGAFELYLPYEPIEVQAAAEARRLYPVLAIGLGVLYLLLFPVVARASSALRRHAAESEHNALHDELTGIANRRGLLGLLDEAIRSTGDGGNRFALLMLDLDRFRDVNDALGHRHGDQLIGQVAERLSRRVRHGDLLARVGGDEFALLARDVRDAGAAVELAERVGLALHEEFVLADVPLLVEASIGIAVFPDHGGDAEALLRAADTAMHAAKRAGTRHELYEPERDRRGPDRVARLAELRRALAKDEVVVYYQPKIDLRTGAVSGMEALVRWDHPERGVMTPADFLALAEQTGLITALTRHVLDAALDQCRKWAMEGFELAVAVNVNERSILDPGFPDEVAALLARHATEGSRLQLELTERSLIGDLATACEVIERLHALGVRLSVDDFGTGYSSLGRLLDLPLQELKIDRAFVRDIDGEGPGAAIVRSAIDLGHHLGLEVVAEGVESETTLAELRELGCDSAQGYHLMRPRPPADVTAWLRSRASVSAPRARRAAPAARTAPA